MTLQSGPSSAKFTSFKANTGSAPIRTSVVTTLLGSCVAACIRDPVAGVGGMNHFLLPGEEARTHGQDAERYGDYLMELLINGLMQQGAERERLEAKLFGGARMMRGLSDIGKKNAEFAERYLRHEGISVVGKDLGGERGRRLQYWPSRAARGRAMSRRAAESRRSRSSSRWRRRAAAKLNCSNARGGSSEVVARASRSRPVVPDRQQFCAR